MDATSKLFLSMLKAALAGQKAAPDREISPEEWRGLFRLAGIHNVLPLVYEAVYREPSLMKEQALASSVRQQVTQQVIAQTMRTAEFLELNRRLHAAGIQPLVVKGLI